MGWNVPKTGGDNGDGEPREQCPKGEHLAVLVALIELGHQQRPSHDDKTKLIWQHQLACVFEVQGPETSSGEPFYFAERYTVSTSSLSNLRGLMNAAGIDDEEDDIELLLGKPFVLEVEEAKSAKEKWYTRLAKDGITKLPQFGHDRLTAPVRPPFVWRLGDEDLAAYNWLPWLYGKRLHEVIAASREMAQGQQAAPQQQARPAPTPAPAPQPQRDPPAPASVGKPPIRRPAQPATPAGYVPDPERNKDPF